MQFAYERLDAYRLSIEHLALAARMAGGLPRGSGFLADQLRRAALSIPLNIAEGVGKVAADDQRRFFSIARGSAMECAAILDAARTLGVADERATSDARILLERIVRMLSVLCLPRVARP